MFCFASSNGFISGFLFNTFYDKSPKQPTGWSASVWPTNDLCVCGLSCLCANVFYFNYFFSFYFISCFCIRFFIFFSSSFLLFSSVYEFWWPIALAEMNGLIWNGILIEFIFKRWNKPLFRFHQSDIVNIWKHFMCDFRHRQQL